MNEHIRRMAEDAESIAETKRNFEGARRLAGRWLDEAEKNDLAAIEVLTAASIMMMGMAEGIARHENRRPSEVMASVIHDLQRLGAVED